MIEPRQLSLRFRRCNALCVIGQKLLNPSGQPLVKHGCEIREQGSNRFCDGVEENLNWSGASAVPRQAHVFSALNHGAMGLLDEQRTIQQTPENDFRLVLSTQTSNEAIAGVEKRLMVIENAGFSSVIDGAYSPNGMKGVLDHQRFPFFRHLLI